MGRSYVVVKKRRKTCLRNILVRYMCARLCAVISTVVKVGGGGGGGRLWSLGAAQPNSRK